jgi:hypothetical protein
LIAIGFSNRAQTGGRFVFESLCDLCDLFLANSAVRIFGGLRRRQKLEPQRSLRKAAESAEKNTEKE